MPGINDLAVVVTAVAAFVVGLVSIRRQARAAAASQSRNYFLTNLAHMCYTYTFTDLHAALHGSGS